MPRGAEPARVLFVSTVGELGGGERCLLRLMGALDGSRWRPLLACPPDTPLSTEAGQAGFVVAPMRAPAFFDPRAATELEATAAAQAWPRRRSRWANYLRAMRGTFDVAAAIRRWRVDLVHANSPRSAAVAGPAARLLRRPLITHVRDIVHSPFSRAAPRRLLLLFSGRLVAASRATAEVVARPDRTTVVYDGLPAEVLAWRPAARAARGNEGPRVGMAGLLTPWKGHAVFIRAARRVLAEFPEARFAIAGSDLGWPELADHRRSLQRLIEDLRLGDRMGFAGQIAPMLDWLADLDVFVHPPTAPDPFPAVVLEACIAGCPIVASRTGGVPEMVGDRESALLVPPGDADALAEGIVTLLRDRSLARRLAAAARQQVSRFDLRTTAAAVEAIYDESLGRSRPALVRQG